MSAEGGRPDHLARRRSAFRVASVLRAGVLSLVLASAPAMPVLAAPPARAHGVEFAGGTVAIGDSLDTVHRIAGKPDRVVPMPARSGGPPFERHEYFFKDRSIIVTVREGRVTGIADNRIIQRP